MVNANTLYFGPTDPRPVKKKTTRIYKSYDEEGRITSEEMTEEVEYEPQVLPNPWYQQPLVSHNTHIDGSFKV